MIALLQFISDYPFLKPAKSFDIEYGYIYEEAISLAKKSLEDIFFGKYEVKVEKKPFYCDVCDKSCRAFCKKNAIGKERDWQKCDLCGDCFERCDYPIGSRKELEAKAKLAVYTYILMKAAVSDFDDAVRRKFAISLARSYRIAMENDRSEKLPEIIAANFGIKMKRNEKDVFVHVSDYLKASSKINAEEWKLYNRNLKRGFVELSLREFYRIVEESMRELFFRKTQLELRGLDELKGIIAKFELKRRKYRPKGIRNIDFFPPCMKKILADLNAGENVTHTARFAITSFMLNLGYSVDDVVSIFRNAPDFDEEKTRYQVEHIAGKRGGGKEYDVPSCSTMKTYHNCVADCGVKHPLEYYSRLVKKRRKD